MKDQLVAQINQQINKEFYSSYLYLDMANFFDNENLSGFGHWFRLQADEEWQHGYRFIDYLLDNHCAVTLSDIPAPRLSYADFGTVLQQAYDHELAVTSSIHALYNAAQEDNDFRTMRFLDWFIQEQAEEEKSTHALCKQYQMFGTDPKGLYLLNGELWKRSSSPSLDGCETRR